MNKKLENQTMFVTRLSSQVNSPRVQFESTKIPEDITIFLMCIEIERLTQYNKELLNQIYQNSNFELQKQSYEIRINDLIKQLNESYKKQQQNTQNSNFILQNKINQLEEIIQSYQNQFQQYTDIFGTSNTDIIQQEVSKLRKSQIPDKSQELIIARQTISNLQIKLNEMDQYINVRESDLKQFEEDNKSLVLRINNQQNNNKDIIQLQQEITQLSNENKNQWNENQILVQEIEDLRIQLNEQNIQQKNNIEERNKTKNQLTLQQQQIQELESQIQNQNKSYQYNQYIINQNNDLNKSTNLTEEYKIKFKQLQSQFVDLQLQNNNLRQSEHRVTLLTAEIERLNNLIQSYTTESSEWKEKYRRIELALLDYRSIEKTNSDAVEKNELLLQEIYKLRQIISSQSTQQNNKYNLLQKNEQQQLEVQVYELKNEYSVLMNQYNILQNQINQEKQNSKIEYQFDQKKLINEYENKIAMLSLEISRLKMMKPIQEQNQDIKLLTIIALMSVELDSLRGIAHQRNIESQRFQDHLTQSVRSSQLQKTNI